MNRERSYLCPDRSWFRLLLAGVSCLVLGCAAGLYGGEAWVLRVSTPPLDPFDVCGSIDWRDQLLFYNTTGGPQNVRLLGVSNGSLDPSPEALAIPPRTLVGVTDPGQLNWSPAPPVPLWLDHLDVPEGVLVTSRLEAASGFGPPCPAQVGPTFGGIPLSVAHALFEPGVPQYHFATDLGTQSSRTNIVVYNAASVPAHAQVALYRGCDGGVAEQRTVTIPPNTAVQETAFRSDEFRCTGAATPSYVTYVIVTVDQASLSFVTTLSDDELPKILVGYSPTQ
jgi:hypothetical protein